MSSIVPKIFFSFCFSLTPPVQVFIKNRNDHANQSTAKARITPRRGLSMVRTSDCIPSGVIARNIPAKIKEIPVAIQHTNLKIKNRNFIVTCSPQFES
jgi:hypothetical protein